MRKSYVTIYNKDMQKVAMLENAMTIGFETPYNGVWRASFSLPANDPKNAECQPLYFAEIFDDDGERIDLFRISPARARRSADGQSVTYQCQHVLVTLLDDVLFQFHTIGNLGVYTRDVIEYILGKQQTARWQVGNVDFARQFEYTFENDNLLSALLAVPKPFVEEYMWSWDTTSYPWTLNLVEPPEGVQAYIRYGVNMRGVERTIDPSGLVTRLYGLGYGEGVNQLTIAEVNGGVPYLDADTQAQYGIRSDIFVDRRFTSAETLKARMEAILNEMKHPRVTYTVQATEIHRLTGQTIHRFKTGSIVRVQDADLGIDFTSRVVNVRKSDIFGQPGAVEIDIANRPEDIANMFNEMASKLRINETYAQGATNFDSHDFADNCDPDNPAVLRFFIPQETARINWITLSYQSEAFRAYSRAIEAAPTITSGPSSTSTTASGGQTTSGPSSRQTTANNEQQTSEPSSRETTLSGGGFTLWFGENGAVDFGAPLSDFQSFIRYAGIHNHGGAAASHNHGNINNQNTAPAISDDGNHIHGIYDFRLSIPEHSHGMDHTHQIAPHIHDMDHTHQISSHTHGMDHTHQIPSHTHGIQYGIFQGPTPTAMTVTVDGNVVPGLGTSATDVDIIPFLSKDGEGKVQRGWHEIKIAPDNLGRIAASVNTQIFVQSRGGGNY